MSNDRGSAKRPSWKGVLHPQVPEASIQVFLIQQRPGNIKTEEIPL